MSPPKVVAPSPVAEEIEEIEEVQPAGAGRRQRVTFVLDESEAAAGTSSELEVEGDDVDDDDESFTDDGQDGSQDEGSEEGSDEDDGGAFEALGQLLMTEDGEAITDVLASIRDVLDKQNRVLYRGLQLLEARFAAPEPVAQKPKPKAAPAQQQRRR